MITLILADDHPSTRAGLCAILGGAPDIQILGEAEDGYEVQKLLEQHKPRVLLLEIELPGPKPVEIEKWVHIHSPDTVALILTNHDRDSYLAEMMAIGVAGYLTEKEPPERLIDAIRRAAQGNMTFTEEQYARALNWHKAVDDKWDSLSEREREILLFLGQGMDSRTIAERLGISSKTVAHHFTSVYEKLGVHSRPDAMVWVQRYISENLE